MRDESEAKWTIKPDKDSGLFVLYRDGLHYRGPETKAFLEAYLDLIMREEKQQEQHHEQHHGQQQEQQG